MIKFFRKIRFDLMEKNKTGKPALPAGRYLKYAIGEIALVVIGILLALQINNWNENKKQLRHEQSILKSLQFELRLDVGEIENELKDKEEDIKNFIKCIEILTTDNQTSKAEFMESFNWILGVGGVTLNKTTYNNLQTSGQISLIKNKGILDSIINYYNSGYEDWESAMEDYARNIFAPYLLEFDYIPFQKTGYRNKRLEDAINSDTYIKPGKSLEDYKQDYFIINALRQKCNNSDGLIMHYETLLKKAKSLDNTIQTYLDNQ